MSETSPQSCMQSFVAALIRKDIDAVLPLLTDDVALFYSNGSSVWGKDAFAAAITANWKRIDGYNYTTDDSIWLAQSDGAAAVIYTFSWSGTADGKEVSGGGRGTGSSAENRMAGASLMSISASVNGSRRAELP